MRALSTCLLLVAICSANSTEPDQERAKKQLKSENYTVTWGTVPAYEPEAELEIADGNGHGSGLGWIRFRPGKDAVEILSIQLDERLHPSESKWPPDRTQVAVKVARLKSDAYADLLRDLAVVSAAKLKPVKRNPEMITTNNFWVYARLTTGNKTLINLTWEGYEGSRDEWEFAKPRAAVRLAYEAVKGITFKDHTLTDGERAWASAKFARDWKSFKGLDSHWFVHERYIEMVGMVGDEATLPVLRGILATDPPKGELWDASDGRCVFYAINAVTRLTKTDVRDKPIEEMDIEKTRQKALKLISQVLRSR